MKLSKSVSFSKYLVFFLTTLVFGFGAGFFSGAYPEKLMQISGQKARSISLLFSNQTHVPMKLLLDFEKSTGISFSVKVSPSYFIFQSEAQKSDLIFAPFAWYENALPTMLEAPNMALFTDFLSSDFTFLKISSARFLPIFWKVEKNELLLWGFAAGKKQSEFNQDAYQLISYLIERPERMKAWSEQAGLYSSLKNNNSKAGIRDYPLSQLSIKHQID